MAKRLIKQETKPSTYQHSGHPLSTFISYLAKERELHNCFKGFNLDITMPIYIETRLPNEHC